MSPKPILRQTLPILFFAGIALFSSLALMPASSIPTSFQFWDKAEHFLAYAALALVGYLAFADRRARVALGLILHGALIEVAQSTLTATRSGEILDLAADSLGVLVALALHSGVARPATLAQALGTSDP